MGIFTFQVTFNQEGPRQVYTVVTVGPTMIGDISFDEELECAAEIVFAGEKTLSGFLADDIESVTCDGVDLKHVLKNSLKEIQTSGLPSIFRNPVKSYCSLIRSEDPDKDMANPKGSRGCKPDVLLQPEFCVPCSRRIFLNRALDLLVLSLLF